MKRLAICVLFLLAACDDSGKKAYVEKKQATPAETVLAKMTELRDKACACKDLPCVEVVEKELLDWATRNMETLKELKPSKEQDAIAEKLANDMQECRRRVTPS